MTPKAAELLAEEVRRQYSSQHVCHDLSMGDGGILWSPPDPPSSEESEEDDTSSDMINDGDDEDDGLFIGAPHMHADDDESIAFSDIVLPTDEDQDPFLMELNEQMAAEAAILAGNEPPIPAMVLSQNESPTDAPTTYCDQEVKKPVRAPSVHTIVAHAVAQKRKALESLSQAELLERLEKRLRPYMKLPLKLPPLRQRKRPNCMFLNYMGTRRPQAPKKRKLAAADLKASDTVTKKQKEETSPLLAKESEEATKLTATSQKPTTVTAPSSPRRIVEPVLSAPSPPKAPTFLPKLLTDPLWENDLVQNPETDPLLEKDLVQKPDKPQSMTPVKSLQELSQEGEENEAAVEKSAVEKNTDMYYSEIDDESKSSISIATEKSNNTEAKKYLTQKELDEAKRSEVFRCIAASMQTNPMAPQAKAPQAKAARVQNKVQKADPPGDKPKTETVSAPPSPRQKREAFTSSILTKSTSSGSVDQEADEEASLDSIHEPLDPYSEGSFLFEPSHYSSPLYSPSLDSDDVIHDSACDSPMQVGRHVRALNHEAFIPFEDHHDDDDHYYRSGSNQESDSSEASSSSSLHISKNMKQPPPPPSFVTLSPNAISPQPRRIHHPSPFTTRRPMLLSPEMDMLAPGARYAYYHSPSQRAMEDHMPPSSPQVVRRRAPIRMTTNKVPSLNTADYCVSDAHGFNRRSSLPYAPLPTQHWVPTLHSAGAAALVTPDAYASPKVKHLHMESADTVTSRGYNIPDSPLVQVHPQDGYHTPYHSPAVQRRVINDSTLHKGEKTKANTRGSAGKTKVVKTKVVKKTPKAQESKKQPKKNQKFTKRSNRPPVKKTKRISRTATARRSHS